MPLVGELILGAGLVLSSLSLTMVLQKLQLVWIPGRQDWRKTVHAQPLGRRRVPPMACCMDQKKS